MKIMTVLALDVPTSLISKGTKETLIGKQVQIFVSADGRAPATVALTAGRMLVLLSANSKANSDYIIRTAHDGFVVHLTESLDAKNDITYRTRAAQLLENLCTHSHNEMIKHFVKETLLPKVLAEIRPSKRELREDEISDEAKGEWPWAKLWSIFKEKTNDENQRNSALMRNGEANQQNYVPGNDEENQHNSTLRIHEETQNNSSDQGNQEQIATKEVQEALLSLTLVICVMLENQNDFNGAAVKKGLGDGAFVEKLKDIVEENCQASADSLRIVKLCGRIAESMMQRDHRYTKHFRNKEFDKSLSMASEIMSSLESCMLFAGGTEFGQNKTVRPLLIDLEEKIRQLVRT